METNIPEVNGKASLRYLTNIEALKLQTSWGGGAKLCEDCGSIVLDDNVHQRFHTILADVLDTSIKPRHFY